MLNRTLLLATREFINTHHERHEQEDWASPNEDGIYADPSVCGSTACFAGWASVIAGWFQVMAHNEYDGRRFGTDVVFNPDTQEESCMSEVAERELGISSQQADDLFYGDNSLDCLNEMVDALLADENVDLAPIRERHENKDKDKIEVLLTEPAVV